MFCKCDEEEQKLSITLPVQIYIQLTFKHLQPRPIFQFNYTDANEKLLNRIGIKIKMSFDIILNIWYYDGS